MKKFLASLAVLSAVSAGAAITALPAQAETAAAATVSGDFIKKQKAISGGWEVVQRGDQTVIVFADNFKAKKGPDLKVFLSPRSVVNVTGKTATEGALLLGELTSNKGAQEYILPAGVSLSDFESVLVHCEQYSVLWGGGDFS